MPPKLKRSTTIQQTVKASEAILGTSATGGGRKRKAPAKAEPATPKKKVRLSKQQTMVETAKEGKSITKGKARGKTRGKTAAKKPKLTKHSTMKATQKEGEAILGKKKLGGTRGQTKAKPKMKRVGTMQATAASAVQYLDATGNNPYLTEVKTFVKENMLSKKK